VPGSREGTRHLPFELIGDHSWDHQYPSRVARGWTRGYLKAQFQRTNTELRRLTGQPVCFVRPPGGFQQNVVAAAARLKMTAALWSVDSLDWRQPSRTTTAATASIVAHATATVGRTNPIVLMHSTKASHEPDRVVSSFRGNTVAALPAVIEWYRSHGYRFVTLDGRA
jgi:peptidoglycan/xylan/chitin deacetylase (PgdA/CDA1 family)